MNQTNQGLPKGTTPTWEIELLVSGATTFALVQLLGNLGDWFLRLQIGLDDHYLTAITIPLHAYVRIALFCLIGAFVAHLAARAYWIGLIGLHSVYGGPPSHGGIKYGPFYRRLLDEKASDMPASIERADNRASLVFGFGVGLTSILLLPTLLMLASFGSAILLKPWLGSQYAVLASFVVIFVVFFGITLLPTVIDQLFGARIRPDGRLGRALSATFRGLHDSHIGGSSNQLAMYLLSGAKSYRSMMAVALLVGGLLAVLSSFGMPTLEPMQDARDVSSAREASDYSSARGSDLSFAHRAFIAAPVVQGDYLEVNVPVPNRAPSGGHGPCLKDSDEKLFEACLQNGLRLSIDGRPVAAQWLPIPARSGQPRLLVAMVDIRDLPRGKHLLRIDYPSHPGHPKQAWQELIHFWK